MCPISDTEWPMEQAQTGPISPQRGPLIALLGATAVSEIGNGITFVALPWFVLQTTGSAALTGLTGFSVAIAWVFTGMFGGTVVDRLGFRNSSVAADLISGIGLGLIPTLYFSIGLPFAVLMTLAFVGSMLNVPGLTARRSMLPELAQHAGTRLERVNAAFESSQHLALLLGPPIAGLIVAWQSASTALWVDAGTFMFSAIVVSVLVPIFGQTSENGSHVSPSYREQLRDGIRFVLHDVLLRDMAITVAVFNGLEAPVFAVALPVFVNREYGNATTLGLMASVFAIGALGGAAIYGALGHRLSRRRLWYTAYLIMPIFYWVLALHASLPLLLIALVIMGFTTGPLNPLMVTIRHERIPSAMRGRVFATYSAVSQMISPIGIVLCGFAIATLGFNATVIALAIALQGASFLVLFVPSLRQMDTTARTSVN